MQKIEDLLQELREERTDNARLIMALEKSERHAADCARQAGDLADGVAKALGISYSFVVPDDRDIIARAADIFAEVSSAKLLLKDACAAIEHMAPNSDYFSSKELNPNAMLAIRIKSFLGESYEDRDADRALQAKV